MEAKMIVWPEVFNLGIEEIDRQHKRIIDLINNVFYTLTDNDDIFEIEGVFDALNDYVRFHLRSEEEFMRSIDYPGYIYHKENHEKFEDKAFLFEQSFDPSKNIESQRDEIVKYLVTWLANHVVEEDRRYAKYYFKQIEKDDISLIA